MENTHLQIIRPTDSKMTAKDAVDSHVRTFKMLQENNDLVVFLISSLNRSNYLAPIDFERFKETGGIEYTADVVWGLQLSIMNNYLFNSSPLVIKKREIVKAAKAALPRKVQLVCLKNRYGRSSYTCEFDYYPQFDFFVPVFGQDFEPSLSALLESLKRKKKEENEKEEEESLLGE